MIDLHLHTTASDGRLSPAELVRRAAAAGLAIISVTDHDTTEGLAEARAASDTAGIRLIDGIEITAVENGRDVHVLGYFFDPEHEGLRGFLHQQRADRVRRITEMGERLAQLGCAVDVERVLARSGAHPGRSLGRPLIADALAAAGYVRDRADAFERLLGEGRPAFVPRRGASVIAVAQVVAAAGGITSLAHPGLTNVDASLSRFAAAGLDAIEVRHAEHGAAMEARYREMASLLGLGVSGGSDFHADSAHIGALGVVTLPAADFDALEARAASVRQNLASEDHRHDRRR